MMSQMKLRVPISPADHGQGQKDAPLVLVEYGDYECPHCALANAVTIKLRQELGSDLFYAFRHFPLVNRHPHAQLAAEAAEAAGEQGKFWSMHHLLFANQGNLTRGNISSYAETLKLDMDRFLSDWGSPKAKQKVAADRGSGALSGAHTTPTFFINGFRYDGITDHHHLLYDLAMLRGFLRKVG